MKGDGLIPHVLEVLIGPNSKVFATGGNDFMNQLQESIYVLSFESSFQRDISKLKVEPSIE